MVKKKVKYTIIRNILGGGFSPSDFAHPNDLSILEDAQRRQLMVIVLKEVSDGYYDVKVGDVYIEAVSWYHLEGFEHC